MAATFIDQTDRTLEGLMRFAADGHLSNDRLTHLIVPERRQAYADACSVIERQYTDACRTAGN